MTDSQILADRRTDQWRPSPDPSPDPAQPDLPITQLLNTGPDWTAQYSPDGRDLIGLLRTVGSDPLKLRILWYCYWTVLRTCVIVCYYGQTVGQWTQPQPQPSCYYYWTAHYCDRQTHYLYGLWTDWLYCWQLTLRTLYCYCLRQPRHCVTIVDVVDSLGVPDSLGLCVDSNPCGQPDQQPGVAGQPLLPRQPLWPVAPSPDSWTARQWTGSPARLTQPRLETAQQTGSSWTALAVGWPVMPIDSSNWTQTVGQPTDPSRTHWQRQQLDRQPDSCCDRYCVGQWLLTGQWQWQWRNQPVTQPL